MKPANATSDMATTVAPDSYLTLHYSLSNLEGSQHVSTFDWSPATLQMGNGQLVETIERCLIRLAAGQRRVFQLATGDAFGAQCAAAEDRTQNLLADFQPLLQRHA